MSFRELRSLTKHFKPPCLLPSRKRTLWTEPYMVRPALVKQKFGNGKRLLWLSPTMHRPNYYLAWVDDGWDLDSDFRDHLDDIIQAIGEEFGTRDHTSENPRPYRWPEEDLDDGCSWGEAGVDSILTPRQRRVIEGRTKSAPSPTPKA
jgi:hypothetical protein